MKAIGYIASWTLYWLGNLSYRVMDAAPTRGSWYRWLSFWYGLYKWLIRKSLRVQCATGCNGPWVDVEIKL